MKGAYEVMVRNSRVQFKFTIERNLTILRGNSATGKTTLIGMIAEYAENGTDSGVELQCERPCVVLSGKRWQEDLASIDNSIVFIDEGNPFVASVDFAHAARESSNYYAIVTRADLPTLPYSVDEIYGIRNDTRRASKYPAVKRLYSSFFRLYGERNAEEIHPDLVIVEDSNSGYEFFKALCDKADIPCISAGGKSNVFQAVKNSGAEHVLVIADGAAFGPEIGSVLALGHAKSVRLFLPESFEWLILQSGLIPNADIPAILENPSEYIESHDYFSWEQFFTDLLTSRATEGYLRYSKRKLNKAYLQERESQAITGALPHAVADALMDTD